MKPLSVLVSVALGALLSTAGETPRYAPSNGMTLTREFTQSMDLAMGELTSVMSGQEVPSEYLPDIDLLVHSEVHVTVTDELVSVAEGRPLVLERTFEKLEGSAQEDFSMPPHVETSAAGSASSPLEGRTVRFAWSAEEETYEAVLTGDEGEELPEEILVDMDLLSFLPDGGVEEGSTWELDASVLGALFAPGGDLAWEWELEEGMEGSYGGTRELEGELTATYSGTEEDGRLALVELGGTVEQYDEEEGDLEHVPVVDGTATTSTLTVFEVEGRFWWDLERGHLSSLEIEAAVNAESVTEKDPGQPGPEFESTVTLNGTWKAGVTVSTE